MKIKITHKSQSLQTAGFDFGEVYDVSLCVADTLINSGWAEKMMPPPENKMIEAPSENK